jgi:hypothetical protein
MLFAIKDLDDNTIDENTLSDSEDGAWSKYLGFNPGRDDQWYWKRQQAQQRNLFCVEVGLVQKPNVDLDRFIEEAQAMFKEF